MTRLPANLRALADGIRSSHQHVPVADVNDHRVILAVNEVPYGWHVHEASDELFLVIEGILRIEFERHAIVELGPMDTYVVPAGTVHRTVPCGRCVNLVIEIAGTKSRFVDRGPPESGDTARAGQ